jgi:predicted nucleic acid-binding protein
MTLIDTSAWIEFFRPGGDAETKQRVFALIQTSAAAYTCPVLYELQLGVREREMELLEQTLDICARLPFTPEFWTPAARCERRLRRGGHIVKRDDILIAVAASGHQVPLLCRDRHFDLIRDHGGFNLDLEQMV